MTFTGKQVILFCQEKMGYKDGKFRNELKNVIEKMPDSLSEMKKTGDEEIDLSNISSFLPRTWMIKQFKEFTSTV